MQHQLGRINIVSWQDRRFHDAHRPSALSVVLMIAIAGSALLLSLHFAFGALFPLELMQTAFAVLAAAGAFALMRAVVGVILRLQGR